MHTLKRIGSVLFLSLALAACGGDDEEDEDNQEDNTPVAAKPLSGTIDGRPFTAVSALATEGFEPGEKWIDIYETQADCDTFVERPVGSRSILLIGEWNEHTEKLSFGNSITFVIEEEDGPLNVIVTEGRLEYIETPTVAGQTGTLRLRAINGTDRVEGEVAVQVCE